MHGPVFVVRQVCENYLENGNVVFCVFGFVKGLYVQLINGLCGGAKSV